MKIKLAALIALLVLALIPGANAGKPANAWFSNNLPEYQDPVEQWTFHGAGQMDPTLWTLNPTKGTANQCAWDPDDHMDIVWSGTLEPGQSTSYTTCVIGDFEEHNEWAISGTPGVSATLTVGAQTITGAHAACMTGPSYDGGINVDWTWTIDPLLSFIPGSQHGYGVITQVTFTFTNTTGKRIRASFGNGGITTNPHVKCAPLIKTGTDPYWFVGSN